MVRHECAEALGAIASDRVSDEKQKDVCVCVCDFPETCRSSFYSKQSLLVTFEGMTFFVAFLFVYSR